MTYRVHEIHPSLIHAPLVLLPTAAIVDLLAVRSRRLGMARVGRGLWIAGTVGAAIAGVSGFASASEVKADDPKAEDMMFLHGAANTVVLLGAIVLTVTRARMRRPSMLHAVLGLVASGVAVYTAYLGGGMVYEHGVGVASMPKYMAQGIGESPEVFSRDGAPTFFRDIGRGLAWAIHRTKRAIAGRGVDRSAFVA